MSFDTARPLLRRSLVSVAVATALGLSASGAYAVVYNEAESGLDRTNDIFADREVVAANPAEQTTINGRLANDTFGLADLIFEGALQTESSVVDLAVDGTTVGATPGTNFFVAIDNDPDGLGKAAPDTTLGLFDGPDGGLIASDDDGSPLGNGFGSALFGTFQDDGTGKAIANLSISGFADFDFDGFDDYGGNVDPHGETGNFDVYLKVDDGSGFGAPDQDFYEITGLGANQFFVATVSGTDDNGNELDTVLRHFDSDGGLIAADDDSGPGFAGSQLTGVTSDTGSIFLRVEEFGRFFDDDFPQAFALNVDDPKDENDPPRFIDFGPDFSPSGDYTLEIDTNAAATALLPIGCENIADVCPGPFLFDLIVREGEIVFIDPLVAVGYDYALTDPNDIANGVEITQLVLPNIGDGLFELIIGGVSQGTNFAANDVIDLTALGVGAVTAFSVRGIETSAGVDPTDPNAFVTGVAFNQTGQFAFSQDPVSVDTDVPEPATLALGGLGLLATLAMRRRRNRWS